MMRAVAVVLLIASFCVPALAHPSAANNAVAEIPFHVDYDGLIIVPVTVNGQGPYDFIVDTGATMTILFENLARAQPLTPAAGEQRRIVGLADAAWLPVSSVGALELGALRFDRHEVVVVKDWAADRPTPQGIVGLDILANYLVVFDMEARMLRLYPPLAAGQAIAGWNAASMQPVSFGELSRPLYAVDASIKGSRVPMLIDLGASDPVINYVALSKIMKNAYEPRYQFWVRKLSFGQQFSDLFDNREKAKVVRMSKLIIGDVIWRNPTLVVFDAKIFEELGAAEKPYGLIGAKLMLKRSFALDFHNLRLFVGAEAETIRPGL